MSHTSGRVAREADSGKSQKESTNQVSNDPSGFRAINFSLPTHESLGILDKESMERDEDSKSG